MNQKEKSMLMRFDKNSFCPFLFQLICSYIFYPLSIIMGVDPSEAQEVGKLVGLKVFATELLAFQELGVSIRSGLSVSAFTIYPSCCLMAIKS